METRMTECSNCMFWVKNLERPDCQWGKCHAMLPVAGDVRSTFWCEQWQQGPQQLVRLQP